MAQNVKDVIPLGHKKSIFKDILHALESILYLPQWYLQRLQKRDENLWIFGAWSGLLYSDNSRAMYEHVWLYHPEIKSVWITRSQEVYERLQKEGKPVAMCNTREGRKIQKRAGVYFWTANGYDADLRFLNGVRIINLWHGLPLKEIGEDAMKRVREKTLFKRFKTAFRKLAMPWEFISFKSELVCGAPFFAPFFRSAFRLADSQLIINPEPRMAFIMANTEEPLIMRIKAQFKQPTILMYMPTFRDNKLQTFNPFSMAGFEISTFEKVLEKQNMVFLYKGHFLSECKDDDIQKCKRIIEVTDADYDNLYTLLKDVDVLITDYSSVYFDFLCLRKPMILFPFDCEEYTAQLHNFYFDYSLMEAKRVYTWTEMEECLQNKTYYPPTDDELQRFRPLPIDNCCERLVEILKSRSK